MRHQPLASRTQVRVYRHHMSINLIDDGNAWAPSSCTLPTEDQPLRVVEFDSFFSHDAVSLSWVSPNQLRIDVRADPAAASRAASLAVREAGCCSFFTFALTISAGAVDLVVSTAETHATVLAALGARAERLIAGATR